MPQDLSAVDWPVRTERLSIRPATADDLDPTWAYRRLPEVGEWLHRLVRDRDEYAGLFAEPDRFAATLVVERDGAVVGDLMLRIESPWAQEEVADRARGRQAELGWVIAPEHAGQGYATEAAATLLRVCFEPLGLHRVTALCFADNVASWRIMERLGMRREAHNVRESLHRTRGWLDGYGYALLAEEWRDRQVG
ncbi:GNAT family N-acetyltransferase [Nocardioides soli]|uniref:RimJ/RimL family protein N-acetyltransferase n=1 Tax=Nocardioides soli TaxID=1036020 RepID=A0A7W4W0Y1_9ACTN|nr:GNAT family N-acetyltransferase [Nocardioides soli]MBB3045370.1 RimJ/RimL family protein N-acetyltransferase [Nocardioides soli]